MFGLKFAMTQEENIALAKRDVVDLIYKEANLEGIAVTYPQTQEIYDGRTVAGLTLQETKAINNLKHAWQFVLENLEADIDLRFVRHINQLVGDEKVVLRAGEVRDFDVKIGGTDWVPEIPTVEGIIETLDEISKCSNPIERGLLYFGAITRGQWFQDGNKRTAQLVANTSLIKDGCGVLAIPTKDLLEARELLVDYYESADYGKLSMFLYNKCLGGIKPLAKDKR